VPIAGRIPARSTRADLGSCQEAVGNAFESEATCACWYFGGLGSRGLIHHALIGAAVAEAVLCNSTNPLPEHTLRIEDRLPEMLAEAQPPRTAES
jgi:hypothetical protein